MPYAPKWEQQEKEEREYTERSMIPRKSAVFRDVKPHVTNVS
jgi:hypothetical protein